jgi:hypothetical protein
MDTANFLSFAFYSRMEFGSAVHLDTEQSNSAVYCNVR